MKRLIVIQTEDKMDLEKFIECCKRCVSLAWDELLIHDDVEGADGSFGGSRGKQIRLLTFIRIQMFIQTLA